MEKQACEERWVAEFPVWRRKNKKWVPDEFITAMGTLKGKWFYCDDGVVKRVSARGFSLLGRLDTDITEVTKGEKESS